MKSHSSKAPRKSFDITKMSGPEIAAEMSRQMTEFKSARKHSDPAPRQESASAEAHAKRSGDHHFLRASLAAGAGSATGPSSLRDRDLRPDEPSGTEGGSPGLAFLRHGARNERSPSIAERHPPQYPRERSYRSGLLAGASLVLLLIGIGSAALWKSGALPDFVERSLQASLRPPITTRSEPAPGPIVSPQAAVASAPAAVDQAPPPPPPTPIILMVTPAPTAIGNPTLTVDTMSAITVLQPDAPAIDIDHGNLQSLLSEDGGTGAATPLRVETAAGLSAAPPAASSTLGILKHLAEQPDLKPAVDMEGPAKPATTATLPISIDTATDERPEVPFVARAKPFVPQGTSPAFGQTAASAAPDSETSSLEQLPALTLSPLPPPIVIRSIGHVSDASGAASVVVSEQPGGDDQHAASSGDDTILHGRRDPNSETDAGGGDGPDLADTQPDRPAASGRGHGGSPSGGNTGGGADPGSGTGGSGGTDGSGGSAGGSTGGDGGTGGSDGGTGGDSDGGDGGDGGGTDGGGSDGGDGGSDGGAGGSDGGAGGSDGGSGGGSDGGAGGDGGSDGGGGGSDGGSGGGSDGGAGGDGGSDGGDGSDGGGDAGGGDGGSSDGDNDGSGDGGDDGSAGGGGLGGALGGLGGALGGALGGN